MKEEEKRIDETIKKHYQVLEWRWKEELKNDYRKTCDPNNWE